MNYGYALKRAWQIIWKHKILWIFGILAGCTNSRSSSMGGSYNTGYQGNFNTFPNEFPNNISPALERQIMRFFLTFERQAERFFDTFMQPAVLAALIGILFLIWIVFIFLGTIGRIGLIRGTEQAEKGIERLFLGEVFSGSLPYFWKFIGLVLLVWLPYLLILLILGSIAIFGVFLSEIAGSEGWIIIFVIFALFVGFIIILSIISLGISIFLKLAQNALVIEDLDSLNAIKRGWHIFKTKFWQTLLMAIILFLIEAFIGTVLALPPVIIIFAMITSFIVDGSATMMPLNIVALFFAVYIPLFIIANGILIAYTQSAWTLTYLQLSHQKPEEALTEDTITTYA